MTDITPLVQVRELDRSFGRVQVLSGLDLQVEAGEVLGIIGPNGAGKSTLLAVLGGSIPPSSGSIRYEGEDITGRTAHWRARHGIATSYQVPRPFLGMTVLENLLVAARFGGGLSASDAADAASYALERSQLMDRADESAGSLRLLDRKRLEVARALAGKPRLLLLDEVAGGLTDQELPPVIDLVRAVSEQGVTVVWIEHVVHALTAVATRMVCLTYGRIIADGSPDEVLASPDVRSIYLGIEPDLGEADAHA
ncbi:ABC transporter ATP-binding protein [Microbacterium aurantiacum]|uniref:ABC transporter ATP-binding protein n=1 Tax=Microbacterium aurantiacum TaxID=162393 RepID=UPI0040374D6B